ncbi:hypothetical protein EVAR_54251_1 [Eumeta japonica]|uniref:Uncharacterized protein n=1 Tax=Eumeta variegata TaxID=151549 RepID=A0A4C1YJY0_EUMVA|nr:hypothetical protein EVAR_54251_1 [Eumeta japonica]
MYCGVNVGTDHFSVVCQIKAVCQHWLHHAKMFTTELEHIKVKKKWLDLLSSKANHIVKRKESLKDKLKDFESRYKDAKIRAYKMREKKKE